ncbi:MAG TPA: hypothetical protein VH044_19645 [Polyangiaceae bacterium]|jgi:hypothetical protein|nr:hypothetical protein [Polyangiaceae bacterium]
MTTTIRRRIGGPGLVFAFACLAGLVASVLLPRTARADDTIKQVGDHPAYSFEVEPHVLLGWDGIYGNDGFGAGVRFAIPILDNGFVPNINNSVAIGFGIDLLHYPGCWYGGDCSANYIHIPVVLQWNFYVAKRWSVFGEPGLFFFHGFLSGCPNNDHCPGEPRVTSVDPAIYVGGRYYINDKMTLTLRAGFPSVSVGLSFMP